MSKVASSITPKSNFLQQEWYQLLVDECKAIITEAIFTSRWALVEGYWELGKRINEDENFIKFAKGNQSSLQDLANNVGTSERTIYYARQTHEKYPDISKLPEGKNLTWNKLITKYLSEPKQLYQKIEVNPALYGDNIYFNSSEKSEVRWDDHTINNDIYPTLTRLSRFFHSSGKEFSLREYARVQDFPDSFKFVGNYSSIKHQIGNAVSPLMSSNVGKRLNGISFIDLFAGCGGLSCGLETLSKRAVYANEIEKDYFQTYIFNFPKVKFDLRDIHNVKSEEILDADIVVGGPPCQGFSTAGLRLKDDPRNELYKEFLRVVRDKQTEEFLMENVPQISEIKEQIIEDFENIGYEVEFEIIKGEEIGMKQRRHRAFFIGKKK